MVWPILAGFAKKPVLEKTIWEKIGIGKADLGKNLFWKNHFGEKTVFLKKLFFFEMNRCFI